MVTASDSRARGRGLDPHSGHRVVSLSKIHLLHNKVLVIRVQEIFRSKSVRDYDVVGPPPPKKKSHENQ